MMYALVLMLLSTAARAAPLDEALALVREHHPVLVAERARLAEQGRQRDWSARVSLSWSGRGTEFGGEAGPNAGVRLDIPLFDRKQALERAGARTALAVREADIAAAFLDEVKALSSQAGEVSAARRLRDLYRDRLAYRRRQVNEGLEEAGSLWSEARRPCRRRSRHWTGPCANWRPDWRPQAGNTEAASGSDYGLCWPHT